MKVIHATEVERDWWWAAFFRLWGGLLYAISMALIGMTWAKLALEWLRSA